MKRIATKYTNYSQWKRSAKCIKVRRWFRGDAMTISLLYTRIDKEHVIFILSIMSSYHGQNIFFSTYLPFNS